MLLGYEADWNFSAVPVRDGHAKDSLTQKNALSMMPQRAMPDVANMGL